MLHLVYAALATIIAANVAAVIFFIMVALRGGRRDPVRDYPDHARNALFRHLS
jgi:hypothetical protein